MSDNRIELFKKKYEEVVKLQDEFNKVVDSDWKNKSNLHDWVIAVYAETGEILNSFPYKWWKKQSEVDIENIKVELVDIFHFILSQLAQLGKYTLSTDETKSLIEIFDKLNKVRSLPEEEKQKKFSSLDFIRDYTASMNALITIMFAVEERNKEDAYIILASFAHLCGQFMDYDELFKLYIGKNALNKIRQDFGYKSGTYVKEWKPGKEDNVIMQEIVNGMDIEDVTFDNVYGMLKHFYLEEVIGHQ